MTADAGGSCASVFLTIILMRDYYAMALFNQGRELHQDKNQRNDNRDCLEIGYLRIACVVAKKYFLYKKKTER